MTKEQRETLERLTDFDYAWYKENVLDKKGAISQTVENVEEPSSRYENIPPHHMAAIERGLAQADAGQLLSKDEEMKLIKRRYDF